MYHSDLELLSSAQAKGAKGVVGLPATVTNQSLLEAGPGPLATRAKYATYKYYLLTQLRGGSQKECADKCFPESSGAVDRRMAARPFCARAPLRMRLPSGNACFPPGEQAFQRPAVPAERPIGRRRLLICTDSQSLIARLKKGAPTATSAVADITNALRALGAHGFRIRFQFVFPHCGVGRNEEVGKAADSACDPPFTSPFWYVDALNVAHGIIREEEALRPNRRYEAVEAVRTKKHPPNRQHATPAAGLRCDWPP
jgi:hypothetical protein